MTPQSHIDTHHYISSDVIICPSGHNAHLLLQPCSSGDPSADHLHIRYVHLLLDPAHLETPADRLHIRDVHLPFDLTRRPVG